MSFFGTRHKFPSRVGTSPEVIITGITIALFLTACGAIEEEDQSIETDTAAVLATRIEAESMTRVGYKVASNTVASGGQFVQTTGTATGTLTKSFTGDKIENLFGPLTDFIKQNNAPLTATIANLRAMSGQIAEGPTGQMQ